MVVRTPDPETIDYPETDDEPMGENTLQFQWINALVVGFERLFLDRPDVFVAGDLFWYPVHGDPKTVTAPDVMVVFGRPKGYRGSYKQWEEGGVAPQVVFEIKSPTNRPARVAEKQALYDQFGVEEYYLYDPDTGVFEAWVRTGKKLRAVRGARENGFTSPRLGVRFDLPDGLHWRLTRPDGGTIQTFPELVAAAVTHQEQLVDERKRTIEERRRVVEEQQRSLEERKRADKLAAKLRELGVDPDAV